ncbi:MAG: hypothetical protein M1827_005006 [Pycnora praestabilis]|nr:MAG: hypothetical protein M1827_005006 [Pycnora praestabilis]
MTRSKHYRAKKLRESRQKGATQKSNPPILPPLPKEVVYSPITKAQYARQQEVAQVNAVKPNANQPLLMNLPAEIYDNIFSRVGKPDMYHCMRACKGLYTATQSTLYNELKLVYKTCGYRKKGEPGKPDVYFDKHLSQKKNKKQIRLLPMAPDTLKGFRKNIIQSDRHIGFYLPHVKTLSVKEPYTCWHSSAFEKSFGDFPAEFQFTNLSCFKYESSSRSRIRLQEMIDTLKFVWKLLPIEETDDVEIIHEIILRQKMKE